MINKKAGHVSLIVKPTRLCNLRCSYCHDWRDGPNQTMSFKVIAQMIAKTLRDPEHDLVNFIWHGGEPTILPVSFYRKALLVQSLFQRQNQIIRNDIQSNGTHLTYDWIRFLHSNKFGIGISLDGPPEIHDRYRKYASGRPSFQDVKNGIQMLRRYEIPFSVLMVIDEDAMRMGPEEIFNFFVKAEIESYGLLAAAPINYPNALPGSIVKHYIDPKRMTNFLIRIYDIWREYANPKIKIREIDGILQHINGKSAHCTLAGGCFGHYYLIDPNGDVSHCDLFLGDPRYSLGNILETDFNQIRNSNKFHELIISNNRTLESMQQCEEFELCNGWCPHQRYLSIRHDPNYSPNCCGLYELITHIRNNPPKFAKQIAPIH